MAGAAADVVAGWTGVGACFVASASFALVMVCQFLYMNLGWYSTFIFLGLESFPLLGLVRVTSWYLLMGVALGMPWYNLWEKGWQWFVFA